MQKRNNYLVSEKTSLLLECLNKTLDFENELQNTIKSVLQDENAQEINNTMSSCFDNIIESLEKTISNEIRLNINIWRYSEEEKTEIVSI